MLGKTYPGNVAKKLDEITGVEVIRLTDNLSNTNHPYFTQPIIDKENKFMIVSSDRSGTTQLFTLSLSDGKMVQITDDSLVRGGTACLDIEDNIVYYFTQQTLKSVRLDNLQTEELLEVPEGFIPSILSVTNDGRYLAFSYIEEVNSMTLSGTIYSDMREKSFRNPASVIMRYDAHKKNVYTVWGENKWISHVNISPVDPNIIMFNHEGNWHLVQRLWIAKVATDEIYPVVKQKYNYERVGHEFFMANGRIGVQYTIRHNLETDFLRDAHFGDVFVDPDGSNQEIYFYPYTRAAHFQMNYKGTLGVADGAHIRKEMPDNRKYIGLNKYADNRVQVGLLCKHNTSWKTQSCHPHPVFTRDDKNIIYSSDDGGKRNVYIVAADWGRCIKS